MSYKFYGIIKGTVSFKFYDSSSQKEIEKFTYSDGMCFGEWAALYDKKRTMSAYTVGDCHLFSLEKELFKSILGKHLLRAEDERKEFVYKTFAVFKECIPHKIDEIYKKFFFPKFYRRNDIIYEENEKTDALYVIYMGEADLRIDIDSVKHVSLINLEERTDNIIRYMQKIDYDKYFKKITSEINDENEKKHLRKVNGLTTVLKMGKGDIGGIEACAGIGLMKHTMVTSSDFLAVMKVDLLNLNDYRDTILSSLIPLFIEKEKVIENNIQKILSLKRDIGHKIKLYNHSCDESVENLGENYHIYLDKLNKKLEVNEAGFVLKNCKNNKIFRQKEKLENKNIRNEEISQKINIFLKKKPQRPISIKQNVKLKTVLKNAFSPTNQPPRAPSPKIENVLDRTDYQYIAPPSMSTNKSTNAVGNSFFITAEEKKKKQKEQVLQMFNRIIDQRMLKETNKPQVNGLNKREKKMKTPTFRNLYRNKSVKELSKMNFNNDKFVEGNYRFNQLFHRSIKSAKSAIIKSKKATIYNTGSYDMPFISNFLS